MITMLLTASAIAVVTTSAAIGFALLMRPKG